MSALLKIVQGPNAGAEIALPDGVEITIGKADSCDIVLADPTLPDAPLKLSADASGGVTLDGTPLEPFHVVLCGSTALAVGPADAAWSPLVWPKPDKEESAPSRVEEQEKPATPVTSTPPPPPSEPKKKKRSWLCLLIILLIILCALFVGFAIFAALRGARRAQEYEVAAEAARAAHDQALANLADRYNLTLDNSSSRPSLSGNFATRAERLAATAELYSSFPGVALDLTDDESLRAAVADSLFTVGQSALTVASVSNRVASLAGLADSPAALSAAIDALRADVPRLEEIVTSEVNFRSPVALADTAASATDGNATPSRRRPPRNTSTNAPSLPVCGILTTPYPCLVLQNGSRVFPGAPLGGAVVASIAADSVVLTNANGSFTWKP